MASQMLMCLVLVVSVSCQRRLLDRSRSSSLSSSSDSSLFDEPQPSSRNLFDEPQTSSSYETNSFFPEFDWSDPGFGGFGSSPEWGFKKTAVQTSSSPEPVNERVVEEPVTREDSVRRLEFNPGSERSNRRSMIGVRTKQSHIRQQQQQSYDDRFDNDYRYKTAMRTRSRDRFRPQVSEPQNYRQSTSRVSEPQDFTQPSRFTRVEEASPVNLRINSMRVSSVKDEVNKADHPGDISFGLFGSGDIGGGVTESDPPPPPVRRVENIKVTTYRPTSFLPITTYRPKRFQALIPDTPVNTDFIPVNDDQDNFRDSLDWSNSRVENPGRNRFPGKEVKIRDFVDNLYKVEKPIKPVRWKTPPKMTQKSPVKDSFGSPYFTLDTDDLKPEPRPFSRPPPPADKELSRPPPPADRKPPSSVFLPTLSPPEPTPSPESEREESIENVFIPTVTSTTDGARFSTSAARDAERRADMAYNSKKLAAARDEEETAPGVETKTDDDDEDNSSYLSNSENLRRWRDELYNNRDTFQPSPSVVDDGPTTTTKFTIDHEFMQGRTRLTSTTTTRRPEVTEKRKSYDAFIPTLPPLDNVLDENEYAKTHIRAQKIVPKSEPEIVKIVTTPKSVPDEEIEGTKIVSNDGNNYGKTFMGSLKPIDGGKVDYMHLKMTDITKVLPMSKLSSVLKKHGFSASDIFNRNPDALRVVGKAMKAVNSNSVDDVSDVADDRMDSFSDTSSSLPNIDDDYDEEEEDDDPYSNLGIQFKEWSPNMKIGVEEESSVSKKPFSIPWPKRPSPSIKEQEEKDPDIQIPWPKRPKQLLKTRKEDERLKSSWEPEEVVDDYEEDEPEEEKVEAQEKSKSLRRNKYSSKKYGWNHEKASDDIDEAENDIDDVRDIDAEIEKEASTMSFKSLVKKISPMSLSEVLSHVGFSLPDIMRGNKEAIKEVLKHHRKATDPDYVRKSSVTRKTKIDTEETEKVEDNQEQEVPETKTTTSSTTTTEAVKEETESRRVASSVDIFSRCKVCKKLFNARSSTTNTPPRFGERTTNNNVEKTSATNIRQLTTKQRTRKPLPDMISKRKYENNDENDDSTTSFPNLNHTLANLNMSESEVMNKKDITVPGIDQIFDLSKPGSTESDIIYGKKEANEEAEQKTSRPKTFVNTDPYFNKGGGNRIRWGAGGGGYGGGYGGYGGNGGRIVTDRRTTKPTKKPTTRIPITYFGLEDELESSKANDILNGDYNNVNYYDYESYDYYYGPVEEVPAGVKSALIASSVVGGLAVSIFLCIFMLCLWKNMKSKLRMSGEYDDKNQGFFSNLMFKRSRKESKKEANGYFNKVLPMGEQHYSTTSSDDY